MLTSLIFVLQQIFVFALATDPKTFIVPHATNGGDDAPAVMQALPKLANGTFSRILFQQGTTYNVFTPINFGSTSNIEIAIEGNLTLPNSIETVQNIVANSVRYCLLPNIQSGSKYNPVIVPGWVVCYQGGKCHFERIHRS